MTGSTPSLAIGPHNTAGQGFLWTEALTANYGIDAISMTGAVGHALKVRGAAHRRIPHHRIRPQAVRSTWVKYLLRGRTHFLDESMDTILGDGRYSDFSADIPYLRSKGMTLGVIFHGSDIRDPDLHMSRVPFSYFNEGGPDFQARMRAVTGAHRRALESLDLPTFVSTPDLLVDLPDATWLPVVVNAGKWRTNRPALAGARPRVMHVPSRRDPPVKGTRVIDPVLRKLAAEGLIDYLSPTSVPNSEMPALVADVDVVVDQIMSGLAGVAAAEGMAAGRLVVGYIAPDVRAKMAVRSPLVDAPPADFEQIMRDIVADRDGYAAIAAEGPGYVAQVHDGRLSARVLAEFMGIPTD